MQLVAHFIVFFFRSMDVVECMCARVRKRHSVNIQRNIALKRNFINKLLLLGIGLGEVWFNWRKKWTHAVYTF